MKRRDEIRALYAMFSDEQLQALRTAFVLDLDAAGLRGDTGCEDFCTLRLGIIVEIFAVRDAARRQGLAPFADRSSKRDQALDVWRKQGAIIFGVPPKKSDDEGK